ncbi:hypothetical protein AMELA_G00228080 [Ameiurus melas]|uniref:Interferon-induced protein 44-like n=1 Tax=Ameiurus melas TaxID=219545 RepID=A0A7J5ZW43_AMEME|nr:hypothetical protein AMELA_G00228080 [Ameiurus melas]
MHKLKKDGPRSFYPFVFMDIMGLEAEDESGVHTDDIKSILLGHVKNGYTFNAQKPIDKDDPKYISNPGLKDKVHCLVSVLPADRISLISDEVMDKMKTVRKKARDLEIPQVVIMSLVDEACPLVKDNLSKIYTSKKIKEKMKVCSDRLGVPVNFIFPVQNYHEQITNDLNMDILILMAMTHIIIFANDYVEDQDQCYTQHFFRDADAHTWSSSVQVQLYSRAEETNYSNNTFEVSEASVMSWVRKAMKGLINPSQSPAPGPNPELDKPWREVTWSGEGKSQMMRKLKDFQPGTAEVRELKILLHGPVGAGKSSFINSVNTVLQGYNTTGALAASAAGKSFTVEFKYHRLKKDKPGSFYPFVFTDIMGLEAEDSNGVQTEDIINILQGHVKGGYAFNPFKPIDKDDPRYISNPGLKDKVHCLVSVLQADRISLITDDVIKKMRAVREKARDLGIPQVVVMTLVDRACPLVQEDLSKIYISRKIKEKMKECSDRLGVPMNCIFPVQNYHEQVTNELNMDLLILMAMSDIIRFANDYVEDQVYNANEYAENQLHSE